MPFVGTGHIWLIAILLIIVLIIWGPGKLPDVGSGLGRAIREFRKASNETRDEFAKATRTDAETPASDAGTAAAPAPTAPEAATHPGTLAEPAKVGGAAGERPTEHVAAEGDHPTTV
jgi:sec-independent protein translocase protein TatA